MQYQEHFGKKFYLDKKTGYWISTTCPKIRAHVWVWENNYGKRPEGFHVHHLDENKSNNSIENLRLITIFEHLSFHGLKPDNRKRAAIWLNGIRHLTKEWHSSNEGKEWHRKHAKEMNFGKWEANKYICERCGKYFESKKRSKTKFCSNACKSANRRDSGIDDIEKSCIKCSKLFKVNKYAKKKFCSRSCSCRRS